MFTQLLLLFVGTVFGLLLSLFGARDPLATTLLCPSDLTQDGFMISDFAVSVSCLSIIVLAIMATYRVALVRLLDQLRLWSDCFRQIFSIWSRLIGKWAELGLQMLARLLPALSTNSSVLGRWLVASLDAVDQSFVPAPELDPKVVVPQCQLAEMRQALARSSVEHQLATCHRNLENAKRKVFEHELEIENIKNDTVAARTRHKRDEMQRESLALSEKLATEEQARYKADGWAKHYENIKLKVDGQLLEAKETISDLRKELLGSKQAVLDLHEKCRHYYSRYRDAARFDIVKKALHQYAEARGMQ